MNGYIFLGILLLRFCFSVSFFLVLTVSIEKIDQTLKYLTMRTRMVILFGSLLKAVVATAQNHENVLNLIN